ncbi:hypothetical protein D3C85_1653970 [compost metagenome]
MLQPLTTRALANGGVHGLIARRAEQVQVAGAEARNRLGVEQHLGHRQERDLLQLLGRPLGLGIKGADRFQLGPE